MDDSTGLMSQSTQIGCLRIDSRHMEAFESRPRITPEVITNRGSRLPNGGTDEGTTSLESNGEKTSPASLGFSLQP